jgi:hypothetical protein
MRNSKRGETAVVGAHAAETLTHYRPQIGAYAGLTSVRLPNAVLIESNCFDLRAIVLINLTQRWETQSAGTEQF